MEKKPSINWGAVFFIFLWAIGVLFGAWIGIQIVRMFIGPEHVMTFADEGGGGIPGAGLIFFGLKKIFTKGRVFHLLIDFSECDITDVAVLMGRPSLIQVRGREDGAWTLESFLCPQYFFVRSLIWLGYRQLFSSWGDEGPRLKINVRRGPDKDKDTFRLVLSTKEFKSFETIRLKLSELEKSKVNRVERARNIVSKVD